MQRIGVECDELILKALQEMAELRSRSRQQLIKDCMYEAVKRWRESGELPQCDAPRYPPRVRAGGPYLRIVRKGLGVWGYATVDEYGIVVSVEPDPVPEPTAAVGAYQAPDVSGWHWPADK